MPSVEDSESSTPGYTLQTVRKALRALVTIQRTGAMSVSELAEELGVGMSTAHRILSTLKAESFLSQNATSKKYYLGPMMAEAPSAHFMEQLIAAARIPMQKLVHFTRETAHLIVREGRVARYVHVVNSPHLVRLGFRLEDTNPVHTIAGGRVLIAHLSEYEIEQFFPQDEPPRRPRSTAATRQQLLDQLNFARHNGYSFNDSESEEGLFVMAAAIRDPNGIPIASISLGGPDYRINSQIALAPKFHGRSYVDILQETTEAVRKALFAEVNNTSEPPGR